ncbi:MAG TPA: cytochrome c biogenesis protein CcdA [Candidatus Limnocylindria bacterium]|nr:cytochrome c biogenesis protein CcdA [Candidatus Limnocylindria bacterium]
MPLFRVGAAAAAALAVVIAIVLAAPALANAFAGVGTSDAAMLRARDSADLTSSLTRAVQLGDGDAQITLTPQRFWQVTGRAKDGLEFGADRAVVFVVNENVHYTDLPHHLGVVLRIDGAVFAVPTEMRVLTDAVHHRTSAIIFGDTPAALLDGEHQLELLVPMNTSTDRVSVQWRTPIDYRGASSGLSPAMLASLFAGLLASMWPCLLQLSAYFLPSVAGLSLAEADRGVRRAPVLRTAVLFVSGIVVVYTLAGAAAGFAAQSLSATSLFDDLRGPITFVAGLVVLAMAARLAVQARAPLVCKMPVLNMAGRFGNGPLGTIALGLAFATGCMTCFGAALVLGMFAYVVTTASPLTGALILFLFSLGIAVPLVVAAVAMARILPLLGHLERNARYLSLASAAIMSVYGVLLLTGSTHMLSDAAASLAGLR